MNSYIDFISNDKVTVDEYLALLREHLPDVQLDKRLVSQVLNKSIFATARHDRTLLAFARICTDGYIFSTIAEIRIHGHLSKDSDFVKALFRATEATSPTGLILAAHDVDRQFMKDLGWEESNVSFVYHK